MVDVTIGALSPTFDVRLYGANPTGVGDSTAAFQAALDACLPITYGINGASEVFVSYVDGGTGIIYCGPSGTGNYTPASLRISRA